MASIDLADMGYPIKKEEKIIKNNRKYPRSHKMDMV